MIENIQHRRGEPVIVIGDDGSERPGTIEFGDAAAGGISVYCERGGRVVLYGRDCEARIRPDPGGARPVWASFQ